MSDGTEKEGKPFCKKNQHEAVLEVIPLKLLPPQTFLQKESA